MTLISARERTVPVTVQTRSLLQPEIASHIIAPIDLSLVFRKMGPIPGGVRGANNQAGPWDHVGASRNPDLTDGSTAIETLTEYTPGHSFAYELVQFTNTLGRLAACVRGEWTFTPDGPGTLLRWTYVFKPRRGRHVLVRRALQPIWRPYMQRGLDRTVVAAQEIARTRQ